MYTITDDTIHDHVYCSRRLAAHVMAIEMTMINAEFFSLYLQPRDEEAQALDVSLNALA